MDDLLRELGDRPRRAAWGAYWVAPRSRFETQQPDEKVVLMLRQHPVTMLGQVMTIILMTMVPVAVAVMWPAVGQMVIPARFIAAAGILWYLLVTAFAVEKFLGWYYSVFLVTNMRLVDIDFINLVYHEITTANLEHVEEPKMHTAGVLESMFDFGTVRITTASKEPTIEASGVPWPNKVVDIISRLSRRET